jgi:hypothetical protein
VNCERHPKPETVWPVRIARGSFGENVPARDLYLSPDHAVFINGVLVPVKLLDNDTSVTQMPRDRVTYFHVELPRHAVILAEGLPVESYLDVGDRTDFKHGGDVVRLFSDFGGTRRPDTAWVWKTKGVARLITVGRELRDARSVLSHDVLGRPGGKRWVTRRSQTKPTTHDKCYSIWNASGSLPAAPSAAGQWPGTTPHDPIGVKATTRISAGTRTSGDTARKTGD